MATYGWKPVFKFVPTDGIEETLDLLEVLPPKSVDADHEPDVTARLDTNRRGNAKGWGVRPTCKMKFEVVDSDLVAYLALTANRLIANEVWTVYLSLDGGLTYRQVELAPKGYTRDGAIEGKTFAGSKYTLDVRGVDLLDQAPALGTGVW